MHKEEVSIHVCDSGNKCVLAWRASLLSLIYLTPLLFIHSFIPVSLSIFYMAGSVLRAGAFGGR